MNFVKITLEKEFVMPLKSNRKVATSAEAKQNGRYQSVDTLELEPMKPVTVYLEGVEFVLLLVKQVFTNEGWLNRHLVSGNQRYHLGW